MTDPITKEELQNASLDAKTIEEVANSDGYVVSRLGATMKSLQQAISDMSAYITKGLWVTATAYGVKDLVEESGVIYACPIAHISSGSFAADLAAGKWFVYQDVVDKFERVETFNDLRNLTPFTDKEMFLCLGHSAPGLGAGLFYYDSTDVVTADDNGLIAVTVGGQRIKRIIDGYITPGMFGYTTLDDLRTNKGAEIQDASFRFGSQLRIMNAETSSVGIFDFANFAGQTDYGNEPDGAVLHNYTDGTQLQLDNVGENNAILNLKNAHNPTKRPDKAADFVGNGAFLKANAHNFSLGYNQTLGYIDKDFNFTWTGVRGTAVLFQNKNDDGQPAFRIQAGIKHDYLLNIRNEALNTVLNVRNDVTYTRARLESGAAQTSGFYIVAAVGDLTLDSANEIVVKKRISTTSGNLQLTTGDTSPVETLTPFKLRIYSTATLPSASTYNGCLVSLSDYNGKPSPTVWSDGTNWRYMNNTTV